MTQVARRRFLQILAATGAAALAPLAAGAAEDGVHRWQGDALGADATIALAGVAEAQAEALFGLCLQEIERLEKQFSLHLPGSAISRLNARGVLQAPGEDFLHVLTLSREIHAASDGGFDPTIQPLWLLFAETYGIATPHAPSRAELEAKRALVGLHQVNWDAQRITFAKRGMALTLNGIAQGYITDRITELLRARGLTSALVNIGEYRAIGRHPDARPWQIGIQDPKSTAGLIDRLDLVDQAVATSGGYGSRFGTSAENHLIDPLTATSAKTYSSVTVRHASASVADGLSTAFSFMSEPAIRAALQRFGETSVLLVRPDGSLIRL